MRRRGHTKEDAEDLTQEFFARLLENHFFDVADKERGRFRSFLLTALQRFMADEWQKTQAQKRGGGKTLLALSDDTPAPDVAVVDVIALDEALTAAAQLVVKLYRAIEILAGLIGPLSKR